MDREAWRMLRFPCVTASAEWITEERVMIELKQGWSGAFVAGNHSVQRGADDSSR